MHEHVGRGPKAGYSFFELDRLTEDEVHHQNGLDTVFASSEWAADVMRQSGVRVPIVVAKPAVDTRVFHPGVTPLPLKKPTPDTCVFLSVGKWSVLKGHDWLVRVFNAAFTVSDDVLLVLACFNPLMVPGFNGPEESRRWERLYMESSLGRAGKIRVVSGRLPTQRDVASLMAGADCGVFLARGEGFNLELAEMLAMGRHCVATNYAAHRDFAGPGGCRLVEVKETEEGFEPPFLPAGKGGWARLGDDEFEQAVAALRAVLADKQAGRLGFNQAGYELFQRQTWAGCARTIMEHLS
jgi:glycosyltransferase involved in cell wall biosynthesis